MFGWDSSEQRDISRTADWEIPVYWAASPSLSGLNLKRGQMLEALISQEVKKKAETKTWEGVLGRE